MSILNVVGAKVWGGGEQYVYDICQQLQQRHRSSYILVDQSNLDMQSRYAQVGYVMTANLYTFKGFLSLNTVVKQVKDNNIDTIICHSGKYILFCIALKRLTGAKLVFIKHNLVSGKSDIYHRWINAQVDAFVCVSKLVYDELMTPVIKDTDKYHIVYNGINPDRFSGMAPFESHLHRPIETFGFVGRITEHKGLYVLLDAMKHIHGQNPKSTLIICGDGTDKQIKHMLSYIRKSGMDGYVQYVGFKSDMVPVYEQMDCLVLPTITREAFGLVICEAMYCGVPVISSGSGAQREMIEHGESGYIVDPLDVDALIHCMNYVMKHTEYQSRIIIKARHTVETKFTISRVVDELLSIIDDIH